MKQIQAYIHPHRINAVIEVLRDSGLCDLTAGSGCRNLTVSYVQRLYSSGNPSQQHYSLDLAEPVVTEAKLELLCEDGLETQLVSLITQAGSPAPGWVLVGDLQSVTKIG
jgi:hypothetical protein